MKNLKVFIEINGKQTFVGCINGSTSEKAQFTYAQEYITAGFPPISISLPISKEPYSAEKTKNFFEGLLPEGFARKTVANWIHATEEDYLTILEVLGSECLGAIQILGDKEVTGKYEVLSINEVQALAKEGVLKSTELVMETHLSLTGASGKVGLYYDSKNNMWYKPIGNAPSTHIVKQSHVRLSDIVTNEQLCLQTAARLGIITPESFIINTGEANDDEVLFATKRYDRRFQVEKKNNGGIVKPFRLHQEDFAQALGISAFEKYEQGEKKYLSKIFNVLRNNATNPLEDQIKLWKILVYDFLVGNTDNHIKNLSLLYSENLKKIELAPAYDIISTTIYPNCSRDMAIRIDGEKSIDVIGREHFKNAATEAGLGKKIALNLFDQLAAEFEQSLLETSKQLVDEGFKKAAQIRELILQKGGYAHL